MEGASQHAVSAAWAVTSPGVGPRVQGESTGPLRQEPNVPVSRAHEWLLAPCTEAARLCVPSEPWFQWLPLGT